MMAALDLTSGLTNGDMALPLPRPSVAFFLQEDIGQHHQDSHRALAVLAMLAYDTGKREHFLPGYSLQPMNFVGVMRIGWLNDWARLSGV